MTEAREDRRAAAKARMAELSAKFIDRTQGDLRSMRDGLAKLGQGDVSALAEIRHLAHRMAGTGATLGFEELGEFASRTEAFIDRLPGGVLPDAAARSRLADTIGAIEAQLARDANQRS
jgi:HPt (histidine-containing phosphotransfer) domain-containing protein